MTKTVVILQPQFFPWMGVFEQIELCDAFVFFDHVQLPQGRSFCSRVQIKLPQGLTWLSVPVQRRRGQAIMEAETDDAHSWRESHVARLKEAFSESSYRNDALDIVKSTYDAAGSKLCEINIKGTEALARYMGLNTEFVRSSSLPVSGTKDDLLLSILRNTGATRYISGRGGLNYIDHEKFERADIEVQYMTYGCAEYSQPHGPFTPFVTALHAVAAAGPNVSKLVKGTTLGWRDAQKASQPEWSQLDK